MAETIKINPKIIYGRICISGSKIAESKQGQGIFLAYLKEKHDQTIKQFQSDAEEAWKSYMRKELNYD